MVKLEKARKIGLSSPLGDDVLLFRKMKATEELGRLFEFELELLSEDHEIRFEDVLGKNLTVRLDLDPSEDKHRHFDGIVSRFCQVGTAGGYAVYHASIRPWLWLLSRTANCRIFQNRTVPDIVKTVFRDRGFSDFDEQLTGQYRTWEYCVQYRETDFHFISRLLEQEGIYYYFRHDEDAHTLVLADSPDAHARVQGYEKIPYRPPGRTGAEEVDYVTDLFIAKDLQPGTYALSDYDFERPRAGLDVKSSMPRPHAASDFEIFDYPGEYVDESDGNTYARTRLEELQAHYERVQGRTNARGLAVGNLFELSEHPRNDQNREYLIVSADYELASNEFESDVKPGEEVIYSCHLETIPGRQPYRTPGTTPKPVVQGPQTAVVVGPAGEKVWPDEYGRVKVQFHWDRDGKDDENSSCWIRVSQVWAGANWGGMHIPHIGQEVIVEFLEGDPDRPIITGRVYNADQMPPFTLPDDSGTDDSEKLKSVLRDDYGNEIVFDATPGDEHIRMHSPHNDSTIEVGRDETEETTGHSCKTVKGQCFDAVLGGKGEAVAGAKYEATGGAWWEGVFGLKTDVLIGGSHSFDFGYRWDFSLLPDIRQSRADILTTSSNDQVISAGDQLCLVAGAKGGAGAPQQDAGAGAAPEGEPAPAEPEAAAEPEAGERARERDRAILNVFPESIEFAVGTPAHTKKVGAPNQQGERRLEDLNRRGELFCPVPHAGWILSSTVAAIIGSVLVTVASEVKMSRAAKTVLLVGSGASAAVLLFLLAWTIFKKLKDEKIEPVAFPPEQSKARVKLDRDGNIYICSNQQGAEIVLEKPTSGEGETNKAHISLDPAGNINITTPKKILIWGQENVVIGKGGHKFELNTDNGTLNVSQLTVNMNGAIKIQR